MNTATVKQVFTENKTPGVLIGPDEPLGVPPQSSRRAGRMATAAIFALLLFIAGLSAVVLTPPFQNADEMAHMVRAYSLSEGQWKGRLVGRAIGLDVPLFVAWDGCAFDKLPFHAEVLTSRTEWGAKYDNSGPWKKERLLADRRFVRCQFACYPPVPHLPQAAAMTFCRWLEVRTFTAMYVGRLTNLLASCALLLAAFYMLSSWPRLQLVTFLFAGTPMCIFLFSSMSADALTIALSVLVLAWSVRLGASFSTAGFAGFVAACVLLSLCKGAYILIPFTAIPLLLARYHSWRARCVRVGLLAGCMAIAAGGWIWYVGELSNYANALGNAATTDVHTQLAFLLANPLTVLKDWLSYTSREWPHIVSMIVGSFGWGEAGVSREFAACYAAGIVVAAAVVARGEPRIRDLRQIAMDLSIVLGGVFMVYLFAYLAFGTQNLSMIAGRYFLPLAPILLACLPGVLRLSPRWFGVWRIAVILFWVVMITMAQTQLAARYWMTPS